MVFLYFLVLIISMSYETSAVGGSMDNDFWQSASLLNSRVPVFIPGGDMTEKYFWHYFAYTLYIKSWKLFSPIEKDKYFIIESLQRGTTEVIMLFGGNEALAESFGIPYFAPVNKHWEQTDQVFLEYRWRCEKQKLF